MAFCSFSPPGFIACPLCFASLLKMKRMALSMMLFMSDDLYNRHLPKYGMAGARGWHRELKVNYFSLIGLIPISVPNANLYHSCVDFEVLCYLFA